MRNPQESDGRRPEEMEIRDHAAAKPCRPFRRAADLQDLHIFHGPQTQSP